MKTLHITNGDAAMAILKDCTDGDDVLPWRDPMHHGPFPAGHSLDDLSVVRARYLAGDVLDVAAVMRDFQQRDRQLARAGDYEQIILWFEHDLLDQLQILQILDWWAAHSPQDTRLDVICIDRFDGITPFRGIGQLDPQQMASLKSYQTPVTADMLALARQGWAAFCADTPQALSTFVTTDLGPLPFLKAALMRHLQDYPSHDTGLTRTETQLLTLIAKGITKPDEVFLQNMALETCLFIGDWSTFSTLNFLIAAQLLKGPVHSPAADRKAYLGQTLSLTPAGQRVLTKEAHLADYAARDIWLGGVHLGPQTLGWAWDAGAQRIVRS